MSAFWHRPQVLAQPQSRVGIRLGNRMARNLIFSTYNAADDYQVAPVNYVTGIAGTTNTAITSATAPRLGTVPVGNGTTSIAKHGALDLSPHRIISASWWAYWDVYANDNKTIWGYGSWTADAGLLLGPNDQGGAYVVGIAESTGNAATYTFTRPSAAAWHHYALAINRNTASSAGCFVWVDGVAQTLGGSTTFLGNTSFGSNKVLDLFGSTVGATQRFGAGRIANFNLWGGRYFTDADAREMYRDSFQILDAGTYYMGTPSAAGASSANQWFLVQ